MTMTEWFLAELESETAKSRRVLEQVPAGKRDWKPHDRSMPFGYLSELVANIPSWVGMAITLNELDIAPKDGPKHAPPPLNTAAELVYLVLMRDGQPMRYFPIGAKADVDVPLHVVEDLDSGTVLELHLAAPEGVAGAVVVDLGLVEV